MSAPSSVRPNAAVLATAFGIVLLFCWAARGASGNWISDDAQSYYAFLTDALVSGQTHLKVQPHPTLLALENPYASAQGAVRLHDATFFEGRYYLYFSAAPVLLLFAPWRALFGTFLVDAAGTMVFGVIGFLTTCALLRRWQRQLWPNLAAYWFGLGIVVAGFVPLIFPLLQSPLVYPVPSTCAYACCMVSLAFIAAAVQHGRSLGQQQLMLAAGSFAYACAIAARPNFLIGLPAFVLPIAWLAWRGRVVSKRSPGTVLGVCLSGIVPPMVVGVALAAYNIVRFGDPLEFGLHYQLAAGDMRNVKLASWQNVLPGLQAYLFSPIEMSRYYPFFLNTGPAYGLLTAVPIAAAAFLAPVFAMQHRFRALAPFWIPLSIALLVGLANLFALCIYPFPVERYACDFFAPLTIAAVPVLWSIVCWKPRQGYRLADNGLKTIIAFVALHSVTFAVLTGLARYEKPERLRPIVRALNQPTALVEEMAGVRHGPLRMQLQFPSSPEIGSREPIVATANGRDLIYVEYQPNGTVRFGYFHLGAGGRLGEVVAATPGIPLSVDIELGSLYPPRDHPVFAGWSDAVVDALRRRVEVRVGGRTVLHANSDFYPNDPSSTSVGWAVLMSDVTTGIFSGRISYIQRLGLPDPDRLDTPVVRGPLRLRLRLPPFDVVRSDPLISTGHPGEGDLFYVTYVGPDRLKFGHDHWGGGSMETEIVRYDPTREQIVDVDLGSLQPSRERGRMHDARLRVRFNGRMLLSAQRPFHASPPIEVSFAYNAAHASAAAAAFTGPFFRIEGQTVLPREDQSLSAWGPIQLVLKFPDHCPQTQEPLVTTGKTGAGNAVYVMYLDDRHVRFGYDHWAVGAIVSDPIRIDYNATHRVEISFGALYPPEDSPEWRNASAPDIAALHTRVRVSFNGQPVIDAPMPSHPSRPEEVVIGENRIGASTAGPRFSGRILWMERQLDGGDSAGRDVTR